MRKKRNKEWTMMLVYTERMMNKCRRKAGNNETTKEGMEKEMCIERME